MKTPAIKGFEICRLIGGGECGRVYAARMADGTDVALKVFDANAVSQISLRTSAARLADGGWPDGVARLLASGYDHSPAYQAVPLFADKRGDSLEPRSLQHQLDAHPGPETQEVVRGIADALAAMHHKRVAHANLKPGNVFFCESGGVRLTDWAQGNMPGVGRLGYTDAVLYQPPAQLRSPDGYLREEGYRWDVYAFGTLAYRMLTGRFPRCHTIFSSVAPPQGINRLEDIEADMSKVADNLEKQPIVTWPGENCEDPGNGMREWILRCLELEAHERPATMIEVVAGLDRAAQEAAACATRDRLLDLNRRAGRRAARGYAAFGIAAVAAIALGVMWRTDAARLRDEKAAHERSVTAANAVIGVAKAATRESEAALAMSEAAASAAIKALKNDLAASSEKLRASRRMADRLFAWAIESDHSDLPPLDGRQARLEALAADYTEFLAATEDTGGLESERARARLHLAEIALSLGDAEQAQTGLNRIVGDYSGYFEGDDAFPFRMARNTLLLGILQEDENPDQAAASYRRAREMIDSLPHDSTGTERVRHLSAILTIHKAAGFADDGDDQTAREALTTAAATLNELADARPEAAVLHRQLAETRVADGALLESAGMPEKAVETYALAAATLRRLLGDDPDDPALMLELAGCLAAMAEAAVRSGDIDGATAQSDEAAALLDAVISADPDNRTAISRKASQLGLRAGILRDQGEAGNAIEKYREGIELLETVREADPTDGMAAYRLALLTWKMARMHGIGGDRDAEIAMLREAADLIEASGGEEARRGPGRNRLRVSSAYLFGDLGHALELAGDKEAAATAFSRSRDEWTTLVSAHPERDEFADGLTWCERRLEELSGE